MTTPTPFDALVDDPEILFHTWGTFFSFFFIFGVFLAVLHDVPFTLRNVVNAVFDAVALGTLFTLGAEAINRARSS